MSKKRRVALSLLGILLCITLISNTSSISNADAVLDPKADNLRTIHGLSKNPEQILKANKESLTNRTKERYGAALTNEELERMAARSKFFQTTRVAIEGLREKGQLDDYAGYYVETATGAVNVIIANLDEKKKEIVNSVVSEKSKVKFHNAEFTLNELEQQMEVLDSKIPDLLDNGEVNFVSYGPDIKRNRIVVSFTREDNNEKNKDVFKNLVDEKYLEFGVSEPFEPMSD